MRIVETAEFTIRNTKQEMGTTEQMSFSTRQRMPTLQLHTLNNVVAKFIKQKLLEKNGCSTPFIGGDFGSASSASDLKVYKNKGAII